VDQESVVSEKCRTCQKYRTVGGALSGKPSKQCIVAEVLQFGNSYRDEILMNVFTDYRKKGECPSYRELPEYRDSYISEDAV